MLIPHSYDYTPREKSMFGNPQNGLICVRCFYEGPAAPESEELNLRAIRNHGLGWAAIFGGFFGLMGLLAVLVTLAAAPWWGLVLAVPAAVALASATGWCGYQFGADSRRRKHTTRICSDCRWDSLIPLDSRMGTQLHAQNRQAETGPAG